MQKVDEIAQRPRRRDASLSLPRCSLAKIVDEGSFVKTAGALPHQDRNQSPKEIVAFQTQATGFLAVPSHSIGKDCSRIKWDLFSGLLTRPVPSIGAKEFEDPSSHSFRLMVER